MTKQERVGFNPLPSQKQGETYPSQPIPSNVERFQSAPLTKARGDWHTGLYRGCPRGFNPLPSQKQGETSARARAASSCFVSIRSPHKSKGRPATRRAWMRLGHVSIRSPHKSKGRRITAQRNISP